MAERKGCGTCAAWLMRYAGDPGPWLATPRLLESLSRWNYLLGERGELEVGDAFSGVMLYGVAVQDTERLRACLCYRVCYCTSYRP